MVTLPPPSPPPVNVAPPSTVRVPATPTFARFCIDGIGALKFWAVPPAKLIDPNVDGPYEVIAPLPICPQIILSVNRDVPFTVNAGPSVVPVIFCSSTRYWDPGVPDPVAPMP